jgi:hypothetical protein
VFELSLENSPMKVTLRTGWMPLLLAGVLAASPLAGQTSTEMGRVKWEIAGGDIGWCIQFLLEPKEAEKEMTGGYRPVPASTDPDIHPAIKRAIGEDPQYANWVSSQFCTWFVGSVTTEGKRYERGDKDEPLAITWWGVAATRDEAAWDGRYWMRMLGSNSYPLTRLMQVARLPMEKVDIYDRAIKGNEVDHIYRTRFHRATIQLTGRFSPDTASGAAEPTQMSTAVTGPLQTMWLSDMTMSPENNGILSGSLQIFGGRGMAKTLNKSPVRLIISAVSGGGGAAEFVRYGK